MKPLIGVAGSTGINQFGSPVTIIPQAYIEAVEKAGGIPVILPVSRESRNVEAMVDRVKGLVLPGGADMDPSFYNQNAMAGLVEVDKELDTFQMAMFNRAFELKMPVLAICRGCQVVNVALGGQLYQDIPTFFPDSKLTHMQKTLHFDTDHDVKFENGSRLHHLFGKKTRINSRHHQSIKQPGKGIEITAFSPDGVIEAAQHKDLPIDLIQWHPELMLKKNNDMLPLFQHFMENCRQR